MPLPYPYFPKAGLFSRRASVDAAVEYVETLATAAGKDAITVFNAAYVLYNTTAGLANERIAELEEALQRVIDESELGSNDMVHISPELLTDIENVLKED